MNSSVFHTGSIGFMSGFLDGHSRQGIQTMSSYSVTMQATCKRASQCINKKNSPRNGVHFNLDKIGTRLRTLLESIVQQSSFCVLSKIAIWQFYQLSLTYCRPIIHLFLSFYKQFLEKFRSSSFQETTGKNVRRQDAVLDKVKKSHCGYFQSVSCLILVVLCIIQFDDTF